MEAGSTFNTANGNDTNNAKIQAMTILFPGILSLKHIMISATEKIRHPQMIGRRFPFFFAHLFTAGYKTNEPAMEIARISTDEVSGSPLLFNILIFKKEAGNSDFLLFEIPLEISRSDITDIRFLSEFDPSPAHYAMKIHVLLVDFHHL